MNPVKNGGITGEREDIGPAARPSGRHPQPHRRITVVELDPRGRNRSASRLMSSLFAQSYVTKMIVENIELIEVISVNSDDIDCGETITVWTSPEDGITTFTDRGIECLKEFHTDLRTGSGGVREFRVDEECETEMIESIMAREPR